jgi:DNA-binding NarL/FixJ family response regulator
MLESFGDYQVAVEASNGKELQEKIAAMTEVPELFLIDVNMPVMNGVETVSWLSTACPASKIIALSMNDNDRTIIDMFRAGCSAYLLKDTHPSELEKALKEVLGKGYYNADAANINFRRLLQAQQDASSLHITEKEKQFLQLACSDLTYKQIAAEMKVSERTVDGYRESLFAKLKVQSRVGLALEAIRRELVKI